jgi:N-acyl-D-amino-acid deacylase
MKNNMHKLLALTLILALTVMAHGQRRSASVSQQQFDVIIKGGTVYNGTGRAPVKADVGVKGDRIASVGNLSRATAPTIIDATGLAVAPGFINMLSHSETS